MHSSSWDGQVLKTSPSMNHAYEVIKDTYGDRVQIKPKNLLKFGRTALAEAK